jgi:CHAD domain-containing protein
MAQSHREVETKYDVDDATSLPDLRDLPGVARVAGPAAHRLEATYFDTADLALARNGITLRRRTGGDDAGWHLKLPVDGARQEIHAALGRSTRTPPIALRRIVRGVVRDRPIEAIATLVTDRSVVSLLGADGSLLALVCDDRVQSTKPGAGGEEEHAWREWEVEQHAARRKLVKATDRLLRASGARPSTQSSKFGRVVRHGSGTETVTFHPEGKQTTERELIGRHLVSLTAELHRLDPLARADVPDAVHQLRTACRRLRGILATFEKSFDQEATDPVRDELRWIRDLLGRPRDLEVLRARLTGHVAAEPEELVRGRPGQWIDSQLAAAHRAAHRDALDAMASERYFALVDVLDSWRDAPPWAGRRDRPAHKRLARSLEAAWADLERAVARASEASDAERPVLLHEVRKAAKRTRFAADTLEPVLGADARAMAHAAKGIQRVLGEHHDTVVAAHQLLELADAAHAAGRDTVTFGVLTARMAAETAEHERSFERVWDKARKDHRRRAKR